VPADALIAAGALRIELSLLLNDAGDPRGDEVIARVGGLGEATRDHPNGVDITREFLQAVELLARGTRPGQAARLARAIVTRLAASDDDADQQPAATAQIWVVIAMTLGGLESPHPTDPMAPEERFQSLLAQPDEEFAASNPVVPEFNRSCEFGRNGINAADSLLARFGGADRVDSAGGCDADDQVVDLRLSWRRVGCRPSD
jgi:hypothetical protein